MKRRITLSELYDVLSLYYGPVGTWPGDSPQEILCGAILVQNTTWKNVEKSFERLRSETNFSVEKLLSTSQEELMEWIRPSGFYRNKSKAIQEVLAWVSSWEKDLEKINQAYPSTEHLRKELLMLRGVGNETADVYLLYFIGLYLLEIAMLDVCLQN